MAFDTIYKTKNESGKYSCGDIGITTEEWYGLICNDNAEPYIDTLLTFLREPQHSGTCSVIAQNIIIKRNITMQRLLTLLNGCKRNLDGFV